MNVWSIVSIAALLVLPGCVDEGEDLAVESTTLEYEGAESGDHEVVGECDTDGSLNGRGDIEDGRVQVEVVDQDGKTVFEKEYTTDFDFTGEDLSGNDGTWKIKGERKSDDFVGDEFKGSYAFTLLC